MLKDYYFMDNNDFDAIEYLRVKYAKLSNLYESTG